MASIKLKLMKKLTLKVWKINPATLMLIAGVLCSSWPLGYWLNPKADRGLASNLEALHQPFNWLFIMMDITCGILVGLACWNLLKLVVASSPAKNNLGLPIAILGAGCFGLFTAIDAILPLDCVEGSPHCLSTLNDSYFVVHGIFSIGSILGLTVSIATIWLLILSSEKALLSLAHITPAMFLLVWVGFGALTLYLVVHNKSSAIAQHFFIGFCSLWLIALPYFVGLVSRLQARAETLP